MPPDCSQAAPIDERIIIRLCNNGTVIFMRPRTSPRHVETSTLDILPVCVGGWDTQIISAASDYLTGTLCVIGMRCRQVKPPFMWSAAVCEPRGCRWR